MIRIKKVFRTDQQIMFIFVKTFFKKAELHDKINFIEHIRDTTRRIIG